VGRAKQLENGPRNAVKLGGGRRKRGKRKGVKKKRRCGILKDEHMVLSRKNI